MEPTANNNSLKPIFVLGGHRSGTTWLANALCNHSQIFGVQSEDSWGIAESWFFSHQFDRFGDIANIENYQNFLDTFVRTSFFRSSQISIETLRQLNPVGYADFFHLFMSHAAALEGHHHSYWLEKTPVHTFYIKRLMIYFPQAKFISIERSLQDMIVSSLKLKMRNGKLLEGEIPLSLLIKIVVHWHKCNTFIRYYKRRYPTKFFHIYYEELTQEPEHFFQMCIQFLDLDWQTAVLEQRYKRNSSFEGESTLNKDDFLSSYQKSVIKFMEKVVSLVPFSLYYWQERLRNPRTQDPIPFMLPMP